MLRARWAVRARGGDLRADPSRTVPPRMSGGSESVKTLVLSGGGMKGVASLGAAVALKRAGMLKGVRTMVGTSAGALVAAALATDRASLGVLSDLVDSSYKPDIDFGNLMSTFGLDSGRHLDHWISVLMGGKRYTFEEVRRQHGVDLVVCATNLSERRPQYFGPDSTPNMDVSLALRMSCAIPLYFAAVSHEGKLFVDGAVSDNFPMAWAAQTYGLDGVLGIAFKPRRSNPNTNLEDYVGALVECSTRRHYDPSLHRRVLQLDTGARSAFEFGMKKRDMKKLYVGGAKQAREWIKKNK